MGPCEATARPDQAGQANLATKSLAVIGEENMPNVPPAAPACPSADVVAQQSVIVMTLKPFSHAVRIVDSTQQFVRKPISTTVSAPASLSSLSRFVFGKASSPFLPIKILSPAAGCMAVQNSEFHVPSVKRLSLAQPARMPRPLFGLSDASGLNMIGEWMTVPPAARTFSQTITDFSSIPVDSITPLTAPCSLPPSVVNSF
mmetsp:Transcript_14756/g.29872  ORF Transcript_14756/g.29872 Transcript_14756/m.29872 type:complete len:201 (+) Transcript_14756:161-763(+)